MPGIVVPMAPEEGADIPVPGADIAPLEDGAMAPLDGGAIAPLEDGAIAPLDGGIIALAGGALPQLAGAAMPLVVEPDPLAGITPPLAFCRLCSLSLAVSELSELPFFIMPECLPCIM